MQYTLHWQADLTYCKQLWLLTVMFAEPCVKSWKKSKRPSFAENLITVFERSLSVSAGVGAHAA